MTPLLRRRLWFLRLRLFAPTFPALGFLFPYEHGEVRHHFPGALAATRGGVEARWANAFLVKHENRFFLFNELGNLLFFMGSLPRAILRETWEWDGRTWKNIPKA